MIRVLLLLGSIALASAYLLERRTDVMGYDVPKEVREADVAEKVSAPFHCYGPGGQGIVKAIAPGRYACTSGGASMTVSYPMEATSAR